MTTAANPATTSDASAARTIAVHLTPFAPGAEDMRIDDPRRWKVFYVARPEPAVRAILTRIRRGPGDVTADAAGAGDVDLTADVEGFGADQDGRHPLATVYDGLTLAETRAVLERLRRIGWTPAAVDGAPFASHP